MVGGRKVLEKKKHAKETVEQTDIKYDVEIKKDKTM